MTDAPQDDDLGAWRKLGRTEGELRAVTTPSPVVPATWTITTHKTGQPDLFDHLATPVGIPQDMALLFERLALDVAGRGFKKYSSNAVIHRLRWHEQIDKGNREFKLNDHWSPVLSRWFLIRHPELPKFFETRERDLARLVEVA